MGRAVPTAKTILVCTRGKKCCKRGSKEVYDALKEEAEKDGNRTEVKKSGCQKLCKTGPTVVVPADNASYGGVKAADSAEIVSTHANNDGKRVDRLNVQNRKKKKDKKKKKKGKG